MNVNLNNFVILVLCKCSMQLTYKIVTENLKTLLKYISNWNLWNKLVL